MKKILIFIFTFLLSLALVSCDNFDLTNLSTTQGLTTEALTTAEDETSDLTTVESTTEEMTTVVPTTEIPTTEIPTTPVPTTTEEVTTEYSQYVEINLYSINDFHGGAYTDISVVSGISAYLNSLDENHLEIANGDIFQGTAISNYYHGEVLVESLNASGFDGFVIGNHEFDWGIDTIGLYADGDETNGELNSPILAANIVYEDTQTPLPFTTPYMIQSFEGVNVGVIGLIGNVESSIAASRLENIDFLDPVATAAQYARELREEHDVDIVVVYVHDGSWQNDDYAALSGLERIDAMFNGHTHQYETYSISRSGVDMPYAQMNNYDTSLVKIKLVFDREAGAVSSYEVSAISNGELANTDSVVDDILYDYSNDSEYVTFISEVLTFSEGYFDRYDMAQWGASVVRDYAGIDIGAVNAGGFRVAMEYGDLTMGELVTIYPFDNVIKTSEMTGQQITDFYKDINNGGGDVVFDDGLTYSNGTLYINGSPIDLDAYYTVGAVDYIFDKTNYDFLDGQNIQQTIYYMRDLLALDLKNATTGFNPDDGSHFVE